VPGLARIVPGSDYDPSMAINLRRLPGPKLEDLAQEDEADLWSAVISLNKRPPNPYGQLAKFSADLPEDVAHELLTVLDSGLEAVRDEAIRVDHEVRAGGRGMPAMALTVLAWLQVAERALAGRTPQELRVLVSLSRAGSEQ